MDALYLLISSLAVILLVILIFNYLFYKYYVDPIENFSLSTIVFVISMSIGLLCVLLIPIDVFLSSRETSVESMAKLINVDKTIFQHFMMIIYGSSLLCSFFFIPFTYFYSDDKIEYIQPIEHSFRNRIANSLKYTLIFILFCTILLLSGLFFRQNSQTYDLMNQNDKLKWIKSILDTENMGDKAIAFVISVFSIFGMLFLILYTGYGLGALPFYLIYGKKSLSSTHERFEMDRAQKRDRIRTLQEKQNRKGQLSTKEKKELTRLKEEEEDMTKKMDRISNVIKSDQLFNRILFLLTPFRVIIGIICLSMSLLIFISLLVTSIDKQLHSTCGINCGYIINETNYTNYIDYALRYLSHYLHLDYLLFVVINFYVFFCSIYGFVKLSIKILCITWYEIKKSSTNPQGLLVLSFKLSLMILAFMLEMLTLAPQYATFGTQTIKRNGLELPCSLSNNSSECTMTNISMFHNRISVSLPFFSLIFYFANWMLILMIGSNIMYSLLWKQEEAFDDINSEDDDNDMDDERMALNKDIYLND